MLSSATKCPYCFFSRSWKIRRHHRKCKRCRREWSCQHFIAGTRATKQLWIRCIHAFLRRRTINAVIEDTGLGHSQVEKMLRYLRRRMTEDVPSLFEGICEADETFVGGQWKNKRRFVRRHGTKRGHGTSKIPVAGVLSRKTGMVQVRILWKRNGEIYWNFLLSCLSTDITLYTDGYKMNRTAVKYGIRHAYVDHDSGEFVRGDVHTNGIEGFWGYLKRNLAMTGGIRPAYLPDFVGELVWRFNHRRLSRGQQEEALLSLL